jgi:prevent-host-death family protein
MTAFSLLYLAPTDLASDSERARVQIGAVLETTVHDDDRDSLACYIEQRLGVRLGHRNTAATLYEDFQACWTASPSSMAGAWFQATMNASMLLCPRMARASRTIAGSSAECPQAKTFRVCLRRRNVRIASGRFEQRNIRQACLRPREFWVAPGLEVAKMATSARGRQALKRMSAKDAKNNFGLLLDCARAAPVEVQKHGRSVVVVLSIEEFERLNRGAQTRRRHKPPEVIRK